MRKEFELENSISTLTVVGSNRWYPLLDTYEVPPKVLAREFDWMFEDDDPKTWEYCTRMDGFFKYQRWWYHTDSFEYAETLSKLLGVITYVQHGTMSSGTWLQLSNDGSEYRVGWFAS